MACSCGGPNCEGLIDQSRLAATIAKHGQQVIAVYGVDEGEPPFVYTIGRTARGQPELLAHVAAGQSLTAVGSVLNRLADLALIPGDWIVSEELCCDYVAMTPTGRLDEWIHAAGVLQTDAYYGRPVDVLCLMPALMEETRH